MKKPRCLRCQSDNLIFGVRMIDHTEDYSKLDLAVETYRDPGALIFRGSLSAQVKADICVDCGFLMLSVNPADALNLQANASK